MSQTPALTEFEIKTLQILRDKGPFSHTSAIGFLLFAEAKNNRKKNPSPQGMALAAGRFLGPLQRRGLINGYGGWSISENGRQALLAAEPAKN